MKKGQFAIMISVGVLLIVIGLLVFTFYYVWTNSNVEKEGNKTVKQGNATINVTNNGIQIISNNGVVTVNTGNGS